MPAAANALSTIARVPQPSGKSTNASPASASSGAVSLEARGCFAAQISHSGSCASCLTVSPAGASPGSDSSARSRPPTATSRARSADPPGITRSRTSTPGWCSWKRPSSAGTSTDAVEIIVPTDSVPRSPAVASATASDAACAAASVALASGSSARPASVSVTRCRSRSNSAAPSSRSSPWIALDTPDCTTCSRRDARVNDSSSATATKYSRWRSSTTPIIPPGGHGRRQTPPAVRD